MGPYARLATAAIPLRAIETTRPADRGNAFFNKHPAPEDREPVELVMMVRLLGAVMLVTIPMSA